MTSRSARPPDPRRRRWAAVATALVLAVPLAGVAACGGPDHLEGKVVAVGKTGQGSRALGGGWVAVFEDDALLGFLSGAGIDVPSTGDLPYVGGRVLHGDVTAAGGSLATVDADGRFTLTTTGRHTVCRLVEAPQVDVLKGCAVVDLPATGTLELTSGAQGLRALLDD